ncbi:MAG: HD domain-containing protein [Candidatus Anstonellales archaeon]
MYELSMLKRIKREGWRVAGVERPESVADHCLRAAQIGFILAELEGYPNPSEVSAMLIFHDIGECRIGDLHSLAKVYTKTNEKEAVFHQTRRIGNIGKKIFDLWKNFEERLKPAAIIAKDADYLEMAISAREYMWFGYPTEKWMENTKSKLKTESAKKIFDIISKTSPSSWWLDSIQKPKKI